MFCEGWRPGVADRLGVGYDAIRAVNPAVIYCSISGYGQTGPLVAQPGHDLNYQALAGAVAARPGDEIGPAIPRVPIADLAAANVAALLICAAWAKRLQTGEGERIDVSMADVIASWVGPHEGTAHRDADEPVRGSPGYGVFETADAKYLTLAVISEDHFWAAVCDALAIDGLRGPHLRAAPRGGRGVQRGGRGRGRPARTRCRDRATRRRRARRSPRCSRRRRAAATRSSARGRCSSTTTATPAPRSPAGSRCTRSGRPAPPRKPTPADRWPMSVRTGTIPALRGERESTRAHPQTARVFEAVVLALPLAIAAATGWAHRRVVEDGFIYFRTVNQITAGHGPVFNVGERVESFTSPLWVAVLSVADVLAPVRLEWLAVAIGLLGSVAGLGLAMYRSSDPSSASTCPTRSRCRSARSYIWRSCRCGCSRRAVSRPGSCSCGKG